MKKIKSILALAAALAVTAGVAQAVTPVTFSLTAYIKPGNIIQAVSINNAQLLQKIGKALNVNLATAKLCFETNGSLVITSAAGVVLYDLSDGVGSNWVTSITSGPNGSFITNYTVGYAEVDGDFDDQLVFWDPIFSGTQTINYVVDDTDPENLVTNIDGSLAFNVKGHAVGGEFYIEFGYDTYSRNSYTGNTTHKYGVYEEVEVSDGSAATFACSLAAGVYKQSFNINAAGHYFTEQFFDGFWHEHDGVLWGTASLSGTQTGGNTFLDPFNQDSFDGDYGNYDTFFNID